jgi:hypothetical protein
MAVHYRGARVVARTRPGRRQPERTCACAAAPYPHRLNSVKGCSGDLVCYHGLPMYGHPAYDGRCPDCDREAYADQQFDVWRDEHGL